MALNYVMQRVLHWLLLTWYGSLNDAHPLLEIISLVISQGR